MIGKILLILLGAVLLALLVLLLIPLTVRVSYENGVFSAWLRYASKKITLYPRPEEEEKPREEDTPKPTEEKSSKKKEKAKIKPNWEQISYSLEVLPRVMLRALRRTGRRITITPLKLHLLVAGEDPADVAMLYGRLHGVLAATLPPLHEAVRIKDQDIRLFPDFCGERMDCIADVGVRLRPWDILAVAVLALGGVIKWYFGFKKRADKHETAQKEEQKPTAPADTAA